MVLLVGYHPIDQHSHGVNNRSSFLQSVTCALHPLGSLCGAIVNVNDELREIAVSHPMLMGISQSCQLDIGGLKH